MKNILKLLLIITLIFSVGINVFATGNKEKVWLDDDKLNVIASFYPVYDFTKQIAKDKVNLEILVPSNISPHDFELTPKDIIKIEEADVLFYNSKYLESYIANLKQNMPSSVEFVEVSRDVDLIKGHSHVQLSTNHENSFDPHTWLSPKNAKVMIKTIYDTLVKLDSKNKDFYLNNYNIAIDKLTKLDEEFIKQLSNTNKDSIIVSHMAFGYLAHEYGFDQVPIRGLDSESEPSAQDLAKIADFAKEENINIIFSEDFVSEKISKILADELNLQIEVLSPIGGISKEQLNNGDDYYSIMYSNLAKIKKALQ